MAEQNDTPSTPKKATVEVGQVWAVEAANSVPEVTFVSPSGSEHVVRVKTRDGQCAARFVLTEPGEWTAGDHRATAK